MEEGRRAIGVWLPLAFTYLIQVVGGLMGGKVPARSEILRGFGLPNMADAVAMDEERGRERDLVAGFEELQKRFGGNG